MEAYSNGIASIRHHETGRIYEIDGDMLDWEIVDGDERQMGPEFHHEAVFEHPELGKLVWGLWEYPVGVENHRKTEAGPHEVVEDLDYCLRHTQDDGDDWFEPPPPDDPFTVFMDSYHGSSDLLAQSGSSDGGHLVTAVVANHRRRFRKCPISRRFWSVYCLWSGIPPSPPVFKMKSGIYSLSPGFPIERISDSKYFQDLIGSDLLLRLRSATRIRHEVTCSSSNF